MQGGTLKVRAGDAAEIQRTGEEPKAAEVGGDADRDKSAEGEEGLDYDGEL